jgi:hypothetical protein
MHGYQSPPTETCSIHVSHEQCNTEVDVSSECSDVSKELAWLRKKLVNKNNETQCIQKLINKNNETQCIQKLIKTMKLSAYKKTIQS